MCQKVEPELVEKMMERLDRAFPGGRSTIDENDGMHLRVAVEDEGFAGKSMVEQHKSVYAALQDLLDSGELHSVQVRTIIKK